MTNYQIEVEAKCGQWVPLLTKEFKSLAEIEAEIFRGVTTSEVRIVPIESPLLRKIRSL